MENVTVGTNNNLAPASPYTYSYGPVQINNDNAIVAALDRVSTLPSLTRARPSSVTVWWPTDGVGPLHHGPCREGAGEGSAVFGRQYQQWWRQ